MANPLADPPLRPDGKLNVGAAVGRGVLAVVRSHPQNDQPYQGMVPIASGEVAEDLAQYLADSEQTNSALALGVSINRDSSVRSAGGFLIQVSFAATGKADSFSQTCNKESHLQLQQVEGSLLGISVMH